MTNDVVRSRFESQVRQVVWGNLANNYEDRVGLNKVLTWEFVQTPVWDCTQNSSGRGVTAYEWAS